MADAEDLALHFAEPGAERHIEPVEDDVAHPVGVIPVRHQHRGQRVRVFARLNAQHFETPAGDGAPRRLAVAGMACEDGVEPLLFEQHLQRLAQPEQQVGRRRVGEKPGLPGFLHRLPVPIGARKLRAFRRGERLVRDGVEAEPGRQHQPLLRAADRHVDAPVVVAVLDRSQGGDRIDEQERRMPCGIDLPADIGDAAGDARGRLVVHDGDGFDLMVAIVGELRVHRRRIDAMPPVARHVVDREAEARRHLPPERGKVSRLEHQDFVARRQRIDQRRLPGAGARPWKDDDRRLRQEDALESGQHLARELRELRPTMVHGRLRQGAQHAIRNVGGTRNLEKVAAALVWHYYPLE